MKPKKITVVGSVNMDMVIRSPRRPEIGESIIGDGFFLSPGGKGANQAVACARMGAETFFAGCVGNDVFGASLRESLNNYGISTEYLKTAGTSTGVALITVVGGDNYIVTDAGGNALVLPETVREYEELLLGSDAVLMQFEIPLETNIKIIELCKGKTPIFLNPAPAAKIDPKILNGIDFFTPNETEAPFYTDIKINSIDDAFGSLDALKNIGVKYPVITLGDKGAVFFNGQKNVHAEAFNITAVDSTAAGDTFAGALAVMVVSGSSVDEAVRFASAAAAISVTRSGAQGSIPSYDEVIQMAAGEV